MGILKKLVVGSIAVGAARLAMDNRKKIERTAKRALKSPVAREAAKAFTAATVGGAVAKRRTGTAASRRASAKRKTSRAK